ncbi:MAG: metalloregulator ArsR/SmtB family transcription factor [Desulfobacteraceae bacterium]|nr:metalloregulator ArsR/SmtB family transcription factor [Desulfobacteraceae bacterium]
MDELEDNLQALLNISLDFQTSQIYNSPHDELRKRDMFEFLNITKALAEENRIRILLALEVEELCVCQIIELLELAPSTVSKHISVLRQARLVDSRKDGRWMYYRLADEGAPAEVHEAIAWVKKSLSPNERIREDARKLKEILKIDREILCSQQSRSSDCEAAKSE